MAFRIRCAPIVLGMLAVAIVTVPSRSDDGGNRLTAAVRRPDNVGMLQRAYAGLRQDISQAIDALEVAAALTTIANASAGGDDVLALPPPAAPDWNQRAAQADAVAPSGPPYQTPGNGSATLGAWTYAGGNRSANVAMTGSNLASDGSATVGMNAGAALTPGPFQFNAGLGGSDSGAWNGLAGSQLALGRTKLNASSSLGGTIGTPGSAQMGYAVSASDDVTDQISVNGGLNWSRPLTSDIGNWACQGALHLNHDLASDLKVIGELGVAANGADCWQVSPQAHATTGLLWTPGGGSAISTTLTDPFNGGYTLVTAASRPFN